MRQIEICELCQAQGKVCEAIKPEPKVPASVEVKGRQRFVIWQYIEDCLFRKRILLNEKS